jgi:hypothetical protein
VNVHVLLPHGEHPYNAFNLSGLSGVDVADGNAEDDEVLGDGNTALVDEGVGDEVLEDGNTDEGVGDEVLEDGDTVLVGEGVLEGWVATGVMLADVAVAVQRKF